MNIQQYREEAKRTCPSLGSKLLDSLHMTIGMMTEIGEIASAFCEPSEGGIDLVNLLEEISDIQWYLANYANMHELEYPNILQRDVICYPDKWAFGYVIRYTSELADFDKKLLAYGKSVDEYKRKEIFDHLYLSILDMCQQHHLDMEYGLERNIAKLRQRFPDKFDADKAINRDVIAERIILENQK